MLILDVNNESTPAVLEQAVKVLQAGGLIIFPTETTYGAGVDVTNPVAVQKLLTYKSRREGKPLSIAVADQKQAEKYVELNDQAKTLYRQFLPGPVTVISKVLPGTVAPGVASEFGTLGVRIPDYPLILDLVRMLGRPITATSANGSGKPRPYTIESVFKNLSAKQASLVDLVLDAGTLPSNPPSTVIDTTMSTPVTVRSGKVAVDQAGNNDHRTLVSTSEDETLSLAGKRCLMHWGDITEKGLVIGLNGPLGVGKTVFAKGVAKFLWIDEKITSPTYSYIQEYDFKRHDTAGKLYHLDMWKVDSEEAFERLEIGSLLMPSNVLVIEWFDQVAPWLLPIIKQSNLELIVIDIKQDSNDRIFQIS